MIATTAIHGIKQDLKNGYLRGLALPTYKTTTIPVKHATDDSGASTVILTTDAEIKQAISFLKAKYGLSDDFYQTIKCESGFNPNAVGVGKISKGVSQFTLSTWLRSCSDVDDRFDAYKNLNCAAKLFSQGKMYLWDCWCMEHRDNLQCKKRGF